jgi:hypothetical protein
MSNGDGERVNGMESLKKSTEHFYRQGGRFRLFFFDVREWHQFSYSFGD